MNRNEKEMLEAKRIVDKTLKEGLKKMTAEKAIIVFRLNELLETLKKIKEFKAIDLSTTVAKYEKKLKSFEGFIDKKYWEEEALMYFALAIMGDVVQNLEEAIAAYEDFKNLKD